LAIIAVLLALVSPAMGRLRSQVSLRSAASQALAALHLARRLALARGQTVTVCPTVDGFQCEFGGNDWMLFANQPGGSLSRVDPDEQVIRRWQAPAGVGASGTRGYAAFQPRVGAATTVTFEFYHPGARGEARRVIVSQTGRPRLEVLPSG
jgi:Tfp pilus assembly protein FimT